MLNYSPDFVTKIFLILNSKETTRLPKMRFQQFLRPFRCILQSLSTGIWTLVAVDFETQVSPLPMISAEATSISIGLVVATILWANNDYNLKA